MRQLGNGLSDAKHYKDALTVQEAELSTLRRIGTSEEDVLIMQNNIAITYHKLGRKEEATSMYRQVYSAFVKLHGEDHPRSLNAANNYTVSLTGLLRFEEAKSLLRSTIPVARRVFGENDELTLMMRMTYAEALYEDEGVTLGDLREAVTTLEDVVRIARRVLGTAHPLTTAIESDLRFAQAALRARETPSTRA